MAKIKEVKAREILDSRGNPTVEVDVIFPTARLAGPRSRQEHRQASRKRWSFATGTGQGTAARACFKAVANVNDIIAKKLRVWTRQSKSRSTRLMIELDGTKNKGKLGANAILGVSLAVAKAAAVIGGHFAFQISGRHKSKASARPDDEHT